MDFVSPTAMFIVLDGQTCNLTISWSIGGGGTVGASGVSPPTKITSRTSTGCSPHAARRDGQREGAPHDRHPARGSFDVVQGGQAPSDDAATELIAAHRKFERRTRLSHQERRSCRLSGPLEDGMSGTRAGRGSRRIAALAFALTAAVLAVGAASALASYRSRARGARREKGRASCPPPARCRSTATAACTLPPTPACSSSATPGVSSSSTARSSIRPAPTSGRSAMC